MALNFSLQMIYYYFWEQKKKSNPTFMINSISGTSPLAVPFGWSLSDMVQWISFFWSFFFSHKIQHKSLIVLIFTKKRGFHWFIWFIFLVEKKTQENFMEKNDIVKIHTARRNESNKWTKRREVSNKTKQYGAPLKTSGCACGFMFIGFWGDFSCTTVWFGVSN